MTPTPDIPPHRSKAAGFTLPAILVVVGALLVLAVGILLVASLERGTARSHVDHQRAELAASAGLEDVRGLLAAEAANDDFLVIQSNTAQPVDDQNPDRQPAPFLFLARGKSVGTSFSFRYLPLFSTKSSPADAALAAPAVEPLVGTNENEFIRFETLPYQDKVMAQWLPVLDDKGRTVARYAYWVEDLQGKLDPAVAGNDDGQGGVHARVAYPFPAPGLNPEAARDPFLQGALDQIALYALDPAATEEQQGNIGKSLLKNRGILVSPDSSLAAAGFSPPLERLRQKETADPNHPGVFGRPGQLADKAARAVEECAAPNLQGYQERPLVPFADGIDPAAAGQPKLNLNQLLATGGDAAVGEMAAFIQKALPNFVQRKGGFPDDYLKTLAANALDYADEDKEATLGSGYRGLDAYPLLSEVVLQINYEGIANFKGSKVLKFRMKLFSELFNPTNRTVQGDARVSYEVSLPVDGIGSGIGERPFDSPEFLSNPDRASHDLELVDGRYWTKTKKNLTLLPNQYLALLFADVSYMIDIGSSSEYYPNSTPFSLREERGVSGMTLKWNNQDVDRVAGMVRQEGLIADSNGNGFKVGTAEIIGKASMPGHVHDNFYPTMHYNMGDQRITYYLRSSPAAENAYPQNVSPNRRNIRQNIYSGDAANRPKVYARVLPSEWPDGGHNSAVGSWSPGTSDKTDFSDPKFNFAHDAKAEYSAPQRISNAGRFFSATELGRIFDPIMYAPTFSNESETKSLVRDGKMPSSQPSWPDAVANAGSPYYGGGNTLRIGRQEHRAFDVKSDRGNHAARLLDLFHTGISISENAMEREGPVQMIHGQVNLNTASREVIRTLAAGALVMDPSLSRQTNPNHSGAPTMAPPTSPLKISAPTLSSEADMVAEVVIRNRPYASAASIAYAADSNGAPVFGSRRRYKDQDKIEWTDSAAEEVFARVYESSTVRSRNFRVWVVAQAIAPTNSLLAKPEVLAEVRRSYCVFADPGERNSNGGIDAVKMNVKIIQENEF